MKSDQFSLTLVLAAWAMMGPTTLALANSVCGKIKSRELSIPSYQFRLADDNGQPIAAGPSGVTVRASVSFSVGERWVGDHWETSDRFIPIPVFYDPVSDTYRSAPVERIELRTTRLWKFGFLSSLCTERLDLILFMFNGSAVGPPLPEYDLATFRYDVSTRDPSLRELRLPDPTFVHQVTLKRREVLEGVIRDTVRGERKGNERRNVIIETAQGEHRAIDLSEIRDGRQLQLIEDSHAEMQPLRFYGSVYRSATPPKFVASVVTSVTK